MWRNLLKSDPAVDLVHFSILRPPDKQDFTPLHELALIPFPTEELFERRLDEFDLIIFDRAPRRGILQAYYFANIARRVEQGGALLITAGEAEAGLDGLYRTALAGILPSQPTGEVIDASPIARRRRALGRRHPVVRGLPTPERWGRWTRQIEAQASGGQTVLQGAGGRPLLVLDRAGAGRVAQFWSDQPWLWARGYDGGGPHGELLRRLAHWLMQEPELEDERLSLEPDRSGLEIERSTLNAAAEPVEIIAPSAQRIDGHARRNRARPLPRRSAGERARPLRSAQRKLARLRRGRSAQSARSRRARRRSRHPAPVRQRHRRQRVHDRRRRPPPAARSAASIAAPTRAATTGSASNATAPTSCAPRAPRRSGPGWVWAAVGACAADARLAARERVAAAGNTRYPPPAPALNCAGMKRLILAAALLAGACMTAASAAADKHRRPGADAAGRRHAAAAAGHAAALSHAGDLAGQSGAVAAAARGGLAALRARRSRAHGG